MANVFKQNKDINNKVNRNNFDLSKQVHSTFKFGYEYPIFCQRVVPGDSFSIDSAFDMKLMPLVFPLQSKLRVHMHYFYVRNKNLWKHWEDWISGLKDNSVAPHPYIRVVDNKVVTGSIYDFLGVPTTVITKGSVIRNQFCLWTPYEGVNYVQPLIVYSSSLNDLSVSSADDGRLIDFSSESGSITSDGSAYVNAYIFSKPCNDVIPSDVTSITASDAIVDLVTAMSISESLITTFQPSGVHIWFETRSGSNSYTAGVTNLSVSSAGVVTLTSAAKTAISNALSAGKRYMFSFSPYQAKYVSGNYVEQTPPVLGYSFTFISSADFYQYKDLNLNYYRDHQYLNALPFRAYESIHRAYYANSVLQPLIVNGQKEFNQFVTNDGAGLDNTDYSLFKRNYDLDYLTSALPSPQMGPAPLVGMTALGDITIEDENGITTAHATTDDDGNISKVVLTSPSASIDHARMAMNIASSGMSINDFRNVNALQRLLETTLRKGYRYKDFIAGHFGVEPKYTELDMPEFIGGYSRDIQISTVMSVADTAGLGGSNTGSDLGSFAGAGRVVGGNNHTIRHFCDDHGWIIGIMSITPTPVYSQLLPKQMQLPTNYLDYYFPEMSQVGMLPITYREVCPLQAYIDSIEDPSKSVDDTFGYQRPNYDMVASVDEAHGQFRETMKDYLFNRQFDGRPELGSEFLQIDPAEMNDVFINRNPDDDVLIGNIYFKVFAKRPVPRIHMPSLGR